MTIRSSMASEGDLVLDVFGAEVAHGDADTWQAQEEVDPLLVAESGSLSRRQPTQFVELGRECAGTSCAGGTQRIQVPTDLTAPTFRFAGGGSIKATRPCRMSRG